MKKKAQSVRVWNVKGAVLIAEMCFFCVSRERCQSLLFGKAAVLIAFFLLGLARQRSQSLFLGGGGCNAAVAIAQALQGSGPNRYR